MPRFSIFFPECSLYIFGGSRINAILVTNNFSVRHLKFVEKYLWVAFVRKQHPLERRVAAVLGCCQHPGLCFLGTKPGGWCENL